MLAAEPAVPRTSSRFPASGHRAQSPRAAAVLFRSPGGCSRDGFLHLMLHELDDGAAQVVREPLDESAKRSIPFSLGHIIAVYYAGRSKEPARYLSGDAAKRE